MKEILTKIFESNGVLPILIMGLMYMGVTAVGKCASTEDENEKGKIIISFYHKVLFWMIMYFSILLYIKKF